MSKILIAMSGGVDSSIAAHLLKKQGHDAVGVMLKLFDAPESCDVDCKTCCSALDAEDARRVAAKIGIDFFVLGYKEAFEEMVIRRFVKTYLSGQTPNPCIDCNRFVKFGALLDRLQTYDCTHMATGHYVRVSHENGRMMMKKAMDSTKDQSYVLYSLTQEQLSKILFPLGNLTKKEVREIAAECEFVNSNKPDSQDICFVPNGKYTDFIEEYTGNSIAGGEFVDSAGNVLGEHKGAIRYTIGQRRGIGVSFPRPMYVTNIDARANTVQLGEENELYAARFSASDLNWIAIDKLESPLKCAAKIRYNSPEQSATIHPVGSDEVVVEFAKPERAITPGQAVVFYDGDTVLGGGTINVRSN